MLFLQHSLHDTFWRAIASAMESYNEKLQNSMESLNVAGAYWTRDGSAIHVIIKARLFQKETLFEFLLFNHINCLLCSFIGDCHGPTNTENTKKLFWKSNNTELNGWWSHKKMLNSQKSSQVFLFYQIHTKGSFVHFLLYVCWNKPHTWIKFHRIRSSPSKVLQLAKW